MKDLANLGKFQDPDVTAKGEARARVALSNPETLWFNTGTLCNIACTNCYIESSPTNDALVYITADEVSDYLDQLEARQWNVREIAFTGGEPFMNPAFLDMLGRSLVRGYDVLVLTNAMAPMMRPKIKEGLTELVATYGDKLTFRISVDHHAAHIHDAERGVGTFEKTLAGINWLSSIGARLAVAGRIEMAESEGEARDGYAALYAAHGWNIDAFNPGATVLFPEMDAQVEVPEITTQCWSILNKHPEAVMCSSSRMVVKRKGAVAPAVLACTLLPYDPQFELGTTLQEAERDVALNHPHCAKFCVLGGASCSA
ncbi:radical SAM protein [uncultured Tateyamaria sp.]|uniref:radical SAM protein n=1 Tax=uncultured Tateyamaria sp. TaxID=455651 RepID=UPI0026289232|nr:radical SAM protein [uncultured Tateyamaria sp.]